MSSRQFAYLSNYAIYSAMFVYTIAFFSHAVEVAFSVRHAEDSTKFEFAKTDKAGRIGTAMMILAQIFLTSGVLFRGLSAHRAPWGNMYEFSITGAMAFSGAYLFSLIKYKLRWLGLPVSTAVLLTLGTAVAVLYRPSAPLVPALKSTWLIIHVSAAIVSGGVFLLANTIAATYLILDRIESLGRRNSQVLNILINFLIDSLLLYFLFGLLPSSQEQFGLNRLGVDIGDGIQKRPGHS